MSLSALHGLSDRVAGQLATLLTSLERTLGDDLVAVLAHGSAVRGGFREQSDVDLVVVLRRDGHTQLEAIGPSLEIARFAARIEVMILRSDEIPRAADVFPLLYGDLARTSVCLFGDNPFASLQISPAYLRLRIEQELREARIRLRRIATASHGAAELAGALHRKLKQLRSPLYALLTLRGVEGDDAFEHVVRCAAARYGVEAASLLDEASSSRVRLEALVRLLDGALDDVDAIEDPLGAPASELASP